MIGKGSIEVCLINGTSFIKNLEFQYPMRFIKTKTHKQNAETIYAITFGGGLISNDNFQVEIIVGHGCTLTFTTQSSTKVFKKVHRQDDVQKPFAFKDGLEVPLLADINQAIVAHVQNDALFCLLPEPVTCFENASYEQYQHVILEPNANCVLVDWFTSGRMSRNEIYQFERFGSRTLLQRKGKRIFLRDFWLLNDDKTNPDRTSYEAQLLPFHCFANLIVWGREMRYLMDNIANINKLIPRIGIKSTIIENRAPQLDEQALRKSFEGMNVHDDAIIDDFLFNKEKLIWSLSMIDDGNGCLVKVAGIETRLVKALLRFLLHGLEKELGLDAFFTH